MDIINSSISLPSTCAATHPLAVKEKLTLEDLYGQAHPFGNASYHASQEMEAFTAGWLVSAGAWVSGGPLRRDVWDYLTLRSHFVFYDYTEPVAWFLRDYLLMMVLFVALGHQSMKLLRLPHLITVRLCGIIKPEFPTGEN